MSPPFCLPTGRSEEDCPWDGEQLSSVSWTKAQWLTRVVVKLNESRQVEKFPLAIVLCCYETTHRAGLGWGLVNGLPSADVLWGIGRKAPGSLGSLFWANGQNWKTFNWCRGPQTESAGGLRANTDVTASGQRECRDKEAIGHTRYAVRPSKGHQGDGRAG